MDALEQGQLPLQLRCYRFADSVTLFAKRLQARRYIDRDPLLYAHNLRWKLHFERMLKHEKQSNANIVCLSDFADRSSVDDMVVDEGDES